MTFLLTKSIVFFPNKSVVLIFLMEREQSSGFFFLGRSTDMLLKSVLQMVTVFKGRAQW